MRFVMGLTVVGAALLVSGLLLTFIGSALGLKSPHHGHGFTQLGEVLAICGLALCSWKACGLMVDPWVMFLRQPV